MCPPPVCCCLLLLLLPARMIVSIHSSALFLARVVSLVKAKVQTNSPLDFEYITYNTSFLEKVKTFVYFRATYNIYLLYFKQHNCQVEDPVTFYSKTTVTT
jgi:hypothetical protein